MKEYFELLVWSIAANFGIKPGQYISDEELENINLELEELEEIEDYCYASILDQRLILKKKEYALNIAIAIIIALATLSACLINIAWELL